MKKYFGHFKELWAVAWALILKRLVAFDAVTSQKWFAIEKKWNAAYAASHLGDIDANVANFFNSLNGDSKSSKIVTNVIAALWVVVFIAVIAYGTTHQFR